MTTIASAKPRAQSKSSLVAFYDRFAGFASKWQSPLLLFIRLYVGYECALAGYGHITHFHKAVEEFRSWHVPLPEVGVAVSAIIELVGGTLLVLGLGARLMCIPLLANFLIAFFAVNLADPKYHEMRRHFLDNQDLLLKYDGFPCLLTAVLVLVFGPGFLSVDGIIKFVRRKK